MEYILLFPLAITLHNIEEALWLPKWSESAGKFHKPVEKTSFHFAVIVITGLAYLATLFLLLFPDSIITKYFYFGFLGAMMINVFMPHLVGTIILKKYSPGLATGLLVNIPINGLIIYKAVNTGIIGIINVLIATVVMAAFLIAIIPVLFRTGKVLIRND